MFFVKHNLKNSLLTLLLGMTLNACSLIQDSQTPTAKAPPKNEATSDEGHRDDLPVPPVVKPVEANWISIQQRIWAKKSCAGCHNPKGGADFLDLSSLDAIRAAALIAPNEGGIFDLDHPEQSLIIQRLQSEDDPMPPRGPGRTRLTPEEVTVLIEWIRLDFPENGLTDFPKGS